MADDLGSVSILAAVGIAATLVNSAPQNLGTPATVSAAVGISASLPAPGTLANPYAASDTDSKPVNFASALALTTDPPSPTEDPTHPSVWFEFTESIAALWSASTSGFAAAVVIEIYAGPAGATADDLSLIASNGTLGQNLGTVNVSAAVGITAGPLS